MVLQEGAQLTKQNDIENSVNSGLANRDVVTIPTGETNKTSSLQVIKADGPILQDLSQIVYNNNGADTNNGNQLPQEIQTSHLQTQAEAASVKQSAQQSQNDADVVPGAGVVPGDVVPGVVPGAIAGGKVVGVGDSPAGCRVIPPAELQFANPHLPIIALATFPGSGNTWSRHLIQQLSGKNFILVN